jgi:hypothetical protein
MGNSSKESMEDESEIHFLTKKQAPISINGDWGLEGILCFFASRWCSSPTGKRKHGG